MRNRTSSIIICLFILAGCILQFIGLVIRQQILYSAGSFVASFAFLFHVISHIKRTYGNEEGGDKRDTSNIVNDAFSAEGWVLCEDLLPMPRRVVYIKCQNGEDNIGRFEIDKWFYNKQCGWKKDHAIDKKDRKSVDYVFYCRGEGFGEYAVAAINSPIFKEFKNWDLNPVVAWKPYVSEG